MKRETAAQLMTIQEAARMMRVSPITVRRHIANGKLEAVRVGRQVRVSSEAVERFMKPFKSKSAKSTPRVLRGKPFTIEDSLWNIVGIGHSQGPTDVSENKYRYLAEAYYPKET